MNFLIFLNYFEFFLGEYLGKLVARCIPRATPSNFTQIFFYKVSELAGIPFVACLIFN